MVVLQAIVDRFISQLRKIIKIKLPQTVLLSKFLKTYLPQIVLFSKFLNKITTEL